MAISIINIARNSLKFTSVNFLMALISLPVTIYVATILVPEEYGIFGFLGLWLMYATLIGPGISSAGAREIPVLLGKGEEREALRIQNTSVSSEMLFSIIPFVVILGASLFFSEPILRIGLIIIAISYLVSRLTNLWSEMNFIREKFNIVAKGNLITAIVPPLVTVASVYWLKVYALITAPVIGALILGVYYWKRGPINYRFTFNGKENLRLVKIGVILQAGTLVFWGFRLADRTIIASTLPLEQLGLYTFAIVFLTYVRMIPTNFASVLQPILYKELGRTSSLSEGFKDTTRIAIYIALGTAILIPIAQLGFYSIVNLITTKYIGSILIFYILSYNLYLASIAVIPHLVLKSSVVNKQKIILYFYSIGLALNIIFDLLVVKLGYGVAGIAWVTICTQGLVTFILYRFVKGYIFRDTKELLRFQIRILFPFLISIFFYFFHTYLTSITSSMWAFTGASLAAQLILWSLVIGIFYRAYLSLNDIKVVMKEVNTLIKDRLRSKRADK